MEYTFKNSPSEKVKKITLNLTSFTLNYDGANYTVNYNDINGVWLNKPGGLCTRREYACTLNINNQKPIYISIRNYDENGNAIEQPNHYNSFIRVLHLHLQGKSKAEFKFGVKPAIYMLRVLFIIGSLSAFGVSSLYLNINPYWLVPPALLSLFIAVCGFHFCITSFPKEYRADSIPLNLLPVPI